MLSHPVQFLARLYPIFAPPVLALCCPLLLSWVEGQAVLDWDPLHYCWVTAVVRIRAFKVLYFPICSIRTVVEVNWTQIRYYSPGQQTLSCPRIQTLVVWSVVRYRWTITLRKIHLPWKIGTMLLFTRISIKPLGYFFIFWLCISFACVNACLAWTSAKISRANLSQVCSCHPWSKNPRTICLLKRRVCKRILLPLPWRVTRRILKPTTIPNLLHNLKRWLVSRMWCKSTLKCLVCDVSICLLPSKLIWMVISVVFLFDCIQRVRIFLASRRSQRQLSVSRPLRRIPPSRSKALLTVAVL